MKKYLWSDFVFGFVVSAFLLLVIFNVIRSFSYDEFDRMRKKDQAWEQYLEASEK